MADKLYWSYAEAPANEKIIIEHTLKYSDFDDIKELIKKFNISTCRKVWESAIIPDERYKKLNHFLAKYVFNISMNRGEIDSYIKRFSKKRSDRIDELLNG